MIISADAHLRCENIAYLSLARDSDDSGLDFCFTVFPLPNHQGDGSRLRGPDQLM